MLLFANLPHLTLRGLPVCTLSDPPRPKTNALHRCNRTHALHVAARGPGPRRYDDTAHPRENLDYHLGACLICAPARTSAGVKARACAHAGVQMSCYTRIYAQCANKKGYGRRVSSGYTQPRPSSGSSGGFVQTPSSASASNSKGMMPPPEITEESTNALLSALMEVSERLRSRNTPRRPDCAVCARAYMHTMHTYNARARTHNACACAHYPHVCT